MKDLLVSVALLILAVIIARLILSSEGLMGAAKDLFTGQIRFLSQ